MKRGEMDLPLTIIVVALSACACQREREREMYSLHVMRGIEAMHHLAY